MNKRFEAVRIARYVRAGVYGELVLTVNDGVIYTKRVEMLHEKKTKKGFSRVDMSSPKGL